MTETKETRPRRKLIDEKLQAPAETSQPAEIQIEKKDKQCQPIEAPTQRKMLAKRTKAQQSTHG